jgi:NAD(P)-dependent dehydrogenase (short-subunit alcohol dehydrogenase family)
MVLKEYLLKGKTAMLAATGRGRQRHLAAGLAEAGADLVLTGHDAEEIEKTAEEVRRLNGNVFPVPLRFNTGEEIEAMLELVMARVTRIDILVNSHNLEFGKPFLEITGKEWGRLLDVNLTSVFHYCRAVGKHMVKQKHGSIINLVSGAGERGLPNGTAYSSSMGGVIQLTRSLAMEWARDNVRVNAVGTGWMADGIREGQTDSVSAYIPMRRRGEPEDIAPLVVFLASEASSYVTGHVYFVDGGVMARG